MGTRIGTQGKNAGSVPLSSRNPWDQPPLKQSTVTEVTRNKILTGVLIGAALLGPGDTFVSDTPKDAHSPAIEQGETVDETHAKIGWIAVGDGQNASITLENQLPIIDDTENTPRADLSLLEIESNSVPNYFKPHP